jgi:hypothetical protein
MKPINTIINLHCFLKQVIEGKIKDRLKLQEDEEEDVRSYWMTFKDRRGYSHLKEEALDRTVWRNRFGRGFGPVVSQTEY